MLIEGSLWKKYFKLYNGYMEAVAAAKLDLSTSTLSDMIFPWRLFLLYFHCTEQEVLCPLVSLQPHSQHYKRNASTSNEQQLGKLGLHKLSDARVLTSFTSHFSHAHR